MFVIILHFALGSMLLFSGGNISLSRFTVTERVWEGGRVFRIVLFLYMWPNLFKLIFFIEFNICCHLNIGNDDDDAAAAAYLDSLSSSYCLLLNSIQSVSVVVLWWWSVEPVSEFLACSCFCFLFLYILFWDVISFCFIIIIFISWDSHIYFLFVKNKFFFRLYKKKHKKWWYTLFKVFFLTE